MVHQYGLQGGRFDGAPPFLLAVVGSYDMHELIALAHELRLGHHIGILLVPGIGSGVDPTDSAYDVRDENPFWGVLDGDPIGLIFDDLSEIMTNDPEHNLVLAEGDLVEFFIMICHEGPDSAHTPYVLQQAAWPVVMVADRCGDLFERLPVCGQKFFCDLFGHGLCELVNVGHDLCCYGIGVEPGSFHKLSGVFAAGGDGSDLSLQAPVVGGYGEVNVDYGALFEFSVKFWGISPEFAFEAAGFVSESQVQVSVTCLCGSFFSFEDYRDCCRLHPVFQSSYHHFPLHSGLRS